MRQHTVKGNNKEDFDVDVNEAIGALEMVCEVVDIHHHVAVGYLGSEEFYAIILYREKK